MDREKLAASLSRKLERQSIALNATLDEIKLVQGMNIENKQALLAILHTKHQRQQRAALATQAYLAALVKRSKA